MSDKRTVEPWVIIVVSLVVLGVGTLLLAPALIVAGTGASGAPTFEALPALSADVSGRPVVVIDDSGQELGDGTVNLYAPASMNLSDPAKIRLEIVGVGAKAANLAPSLTGTPSPTPSAKEILSIHEIMGATLQGVDTFHFLINTVPGNGLRNVDPKTTTWWEWNLRAAGPQSAGKNSLELFVYYPRSTASGAALNQEIATFPITIEVVAPATPTPGILDQINQSLSPVVKIAGAITAIAGAAGVIYGVYRTITRRRRGSGKGRR